mmetsp:Transcript_46960/g.124297  ORF Transcript_46960/g.124297 Transcript_46960/m.124297 type:complete len:237 (+) Transcript_46960:508-1218(+)
MLARSACSAPWSSSPSVRRGAGNVPRPPRASRSSSHPYRRRRRRIRAWGGVRIGPRPRQRTGPTCGSPLPSSSRAGSCCSPSPPLAARSQHRAASSGGTGRNCHSYALCGILNAAAPDPRATPEMAYSKNGFENPPQGNHHPCACARRAWRHEIGQTPRGRGRAPLSSLAAAARTPACPPGTATAGSAPRSRPPARRPPPPQRRAGPASARAPGPAPCPWRAKLQFRVAPPPLGRG